MMKKNKASEKRKSSNKIFPFSTIVHLLEPANYHGTNLKKKPYFAPKIYTRGLCEYHHHINCQIAICLFRNIEPVPNKGISQLFQVNNPLSRRTERIIIMKFRLEIKKENWEQLRKFGRHESC